MRACPYCDGEGRVNTGDDWMDPDTGAWSPIIAPCDHCGGTGGLDTWKTLGDTAQLIVDALTPLKGISTNSDGPGADPYKDPEWLGNWNGHSIFKLKNGLYWVFNTGCWETIEAARDSIDAYLDAGENTY